MAEALEAPALYLIIDEFINDELLLMIGKIPVAERSPVAEALEAPALETLEGLETLHLSPSAHPAELGC